ncbi:uncharacterized protein BO87DRAFT_388046 [Aspergillus neoniger CBS 115656]|uniref:Uncharacterized protein n=1 Tax=Aspergillus neoniger (strain CBS 115656) TaxID=1448310 RepID=A0A318YGN0_ASPNB|nr:hypothetical protein BO87DRAFT_388046 [Aspergillus neoniger CBS 115656]PYH32857.1 hypothetical protein BO87DRAFT_388046 [Aspergillus neoniger CBS 115656]
MDACKFFQHYTEASCKKAMLSMSFIKDLMPIGSGMDVLTAKISSNENRAVTYQIPMLQDHRSTQGCIPIVDDGNVLLAMAWTTPGHGGSQKRILGDNQEPARMRICRSGPTIQREWAGKALGWSPRTVGSIRDISRSTQTSALIADQWKEGMYAIVIFFFEPTISGLK